MMSTMVNVRHPRITATLGRPVQDWLFDQRALGKSWRQCAAELTELTGIEISHEACRQWSLDEAVSA